MPVFFCGLLIFVVSEKVIPTGFDFIRKILLGNVMVFELMRIFIELTFITVVLAVIVLVLKRARNRAGFSMTYVCLSRVIGKVG